MINGNYFKDKTVLITGASSGIGLELAKQLHRYGAKLLLVARSQEKLLLEFSNYDPSPDYLVGDLTDNQTIEKLKDICTQHPLDIAILNAGTCLYMEAQHFDSKQFWWLMEQNVLSMSLCIQAVLPALLKKKGQLVLMSSLAAYGGLTKASAYGASKAAIRVLAQSLDLDLRGRGVAVTCVCPGFVKTPLTDQNTFAMPFLVSTQTAAHHILKGIIKKEHEVYFPFLFSILLKLFTSLPASWQYNVLRWSNRNV